jgi:hypothetical protein
MRHLTVFFQAICTIMFTIELCRGNEHGQLIFLGFMVLWAVYQMHEDAKKDRAALRALLDQIAEAQDK